MDRTINKLHNHSKTSALNHPHKNLEGNMETSWIQEPLNRANSTPANRKTGKILSKMRAKYMKRSINRVERGKFEQNADQSGTNCRPRTTRSSSETRFAPENPSVHAETNPVPVNRKSDLSTWAECVDRREGSRSPPTTRSPFLLRFGLIELKLFLFGLYPGGISFGYKTKAVAVGRASFCKGPW